MRDTSLVQQVVILRTAYPWEPDQNHNVGWLVQWTTSDGMTFSQWFRTWTEASAWVNEELQL